MLVEKPIYKYLGTPDNSHWPGCAVQNASTKRVENKLLISIPRRMAAVAKQDLSMTRGWPDILVKVLMADSGLVGSAGTCQVNSLKDPLKPLLLWDSEPASGPCVAVALSIHLEAIVTSAKHGTSSSRTPPCDVAAKASTPEGSIERELLWLLRPECRLCRLMSHRAQGQRRKPLEIFGDVLITGSRVSDPSGVVSDLPGLLNSLPCSSRLLLPLAEPAWASRSCKKADFHLRALRGCI